MSESERIPLLIIGASGHAKVIADAAIQGNRFRVIGLLDDDQETWGQRILDCPILGGMEKLDQDECANAEVVIAIGDNKGRASVVVAIEHQGCSFATVIHPSAQIAADVLIGEGTVVLAGAVINPGSRIGRHVIVNTSASIDHDNVIKDFVHISPGAHLAGNSKIERGAHIGMGANVLPNVTVGARSVIGAGAVVTSDIPAAVVAVGIPAKVRHEVERDR